MLTKSDISILQGAIEVQLAVHKRRFNAERNTAIKNLIAEEIVKVEALLVSLNNPALVSHK